MKKKLSQTPNATAVENTEQKLKRLSAVRVNKALNAISLCGNLASYKPTAEQSKRITDALDSAVDSVEKRLAGTVSASQAFTL